MVRKKAAETSGFVVRLNRACDDVPHIIPPYGEGRQIELAKKMGMSQEGVRKWFAGESMPRREAMRRLAAILEIEEPWLALGITPEITKAEKKVNARIVEGAVLLCMGLMTMAGGTCAQPGESDPNAAFVDFYAIMRGMQFSINVSLARQVSSGHFVMPIPRQFMQVRVIGVIPLGKGRFDFIDMPSGAIDEHKTRKAGDFVVSVSQANGDYITGAFTWPKIQGFERLA